MRITAYWLLTARARCRHQCTASFLVFLLISYQNDVVEPGHGSGVPVQIARALPHSQQEGHGQELFILSWGRQKKRGGPAFVRQGSECKPDGIKPSLLHGRAARTAWWAFDNEWEGAQNPMWGSRPRVVGYPDYGAVGAQHGGAQRVEPVDVQRPRRALSRLREIHRQSKGRARWQDSQRKMINRPDN